MYYYLFVLSYSYAYAYPYAKWLVTCRTVVLDCSIDIRIYKSTRLYDLELSFDH